MSDEEEAIGALPLCPVCFNDEPGIDHEIFWTTEWVEGRMKPVMCCTYAGTPLDKSSIDGPVSE